MESFTVNLFDHVKLTSEFVFRIIFIILLSSFLYAQLQLPIKTLRVKNTKKISLLKSIVMMNTFLIVINGVYGFYVFLQIKYLFLNMGVLPNNITYADYAREGFFQLVVVTLINIFLMLIFELLNHSGVLSQRILEGLTLILTMVMAVAAFYRMHLYENSYGYTRLRLLVFIFLGMLMMVMVFFFFFLVWRKVELLNGLVILTLMFYLVVSWLNIDGTVAKWNIARYEKEGKIDIDYLLTLSKDAKSSIEQLESLHPELFVNEEYSLELYLEQDSNCHWQEWNLQK
jgi:hypothetical protein